MYVWLEMTALRYACLPEISCIDTNRVAVTVVHTKFTTSAFSEYWINSILAGCQVFEEASIQWYGIHCYRKWRSPSSWKLLLTSVHQLTQMYTKSWCSDLPSYAHHASRIWPANSDFNHATGTRKIKLEFIHLINRTCYSWVDWPSGSDHSFALSVTQRKRFG